MTDTTIAAEAARMTAETEASREVTTQAVPDDPNPPGETAPHPDPLPASGERETAPAEQKPLERITAADRSRSEIAARFKEKRAAQAGQVEFHGDMRDPSQTYGPLGLAPEQISEVAGQRSEEKPPAQNQPWTEAPPVESAPPSSDLRHPISEPAPSPSESRLVKVKVHGREMFLPEEQVIAEAQKSLAAGNLLESAKEVLSGARNQTTDEAGRTADPSESDPYITLAQTLQLDDAAAAGSRLKQAIESETAKARQEAAREAARQVRLENELAVSQKALATFERAHPDLASEEFARDAVTTQVHREINADLQAAVTQGILKEMPQTQDERNGLHTQLRAFGAPVRAMGDLFASAGSKYASWRGGSAASRPAPQPQPHTTTQPTAPAAPRVELTTARQERRAQIVTQPTTGTAPPRAVLPPEQTTAQRRSAAIMAMRKARGQIVA